MGLAWLLWLVFLAILGLSVRAASAEPDSHWSTNHDADPTDGVSATTLDVPADDERIATGVEPYGGDRDAASDAREEALRRQSSWLGRIDISITWRAAWSETTARRDEVLLVGTWRL